MNGKMKTVSIVIGSILVVGILYVYNSFKVTAPASSEKEVAIEESKTIDEKENAEDIKNEENLESKGDSAYKEVSEVQNKEKSTADSNGKLIFKSNLGFSITFPDNWKDKYRIEEDSNSVSVYFKSSDPNIDSKSGLFFLIIKQDDSLDPTMFDTIDVENYITVNDDIYFIGGPTDVSLSEETSDFNTFISMNKDCKEIIDSIVSIK